MRALCLLLLLVGCSRGGAECLDSPDCPGGMACDLQILRCVQVDEPSDLMTRADPLDFSAPDLSPADLGGCARACGPSDMGAPTSCCNASCVDRKKNVNHCGRCFNVCGASTPYCCDGMCGSTPCR